MPLILSPAPASVAQPRTEPIGYLASVHIGKPLPLQVRRSAAGYFIGTADENGPVSRESVEYFRTHHAAADALATGRWQQRAHP